MLVHLPVSAHCDFVPHKGVCVCVGSLYVLSSQPALAWTVCASHVPSSASLPGCFIGITSSLANFITTHVRFLFIRLNGSWADHVSSRGSVRGKAQVWVGHFQLLAALTWDCGHREEVEDPKAASPSTVTCRTSELPMASFCPRFVSWLLCIFCT